MSGSSPAERLRHAPVPLAAAIDRGTATAPFPTPLTPLIGRDAETAAVCALLGRDDVRLVTLTGPGGVGKTRLALRVAAESAAKFEAGIRFVPLAAIVDSGLVLPMVARALGVRDGGERPLTEQLHDVFCRQALLLVIDNLEQVLAAAPDLARLLAACPRLAILATSRTLLRVSGEHGFLVPPLALPGFQSAGTDPRPGPRFVAEVAASDAVRLFVAHAQAIDPGLTLTETNAAEIAEICHRLDGLPLAIELAAARGNVFSPAAMVARLEQRLPLLIGGPRDQPARLRTMRDAIAWGHDLLSPAERAAFRRLAVFRGGFTLEAAEAIAAPLPPTPEAQPANPERQDAPSTLDLVASLVDRSLLRRGPPIGDLEEDLPRFAMLETIREFALEQLAVSGETEATSQRHAGWCVAFVERIQRTGGLSQGRWLAAVEAEHPNLRGALAWLVEHDATTALHLAGLLAEFWLRHGHLAEGAAWLEQALAADRSGPSAARVEALVGLNMLLWPRDQYERAEQLLAEAEAMATAVGDDRALAYARLHQGYLAAFRGDPKLVVARGEAAAAYFEATADPIHLDGALWLLARAALAAGEAERAMALFERLLATARGWGDEISIANGLLGLALLAERRGAAHRALANYAEAAAVCRGFGDGWAACHGLDGAAAAAVALGRLEAAARLFAAADAVRRGVGAAPVSPFVVDRPSRERALETARQALGPEHIAAAMAAGAALSLEEAVDEAVALTAPGSAMAAVPDTGPPANGGQHLTARERDVLRKLTAGQSDKEIAAALGMSRRTASNHVAAIRAKLGASSRTAAAAIALRDGLT